MISLSAKQAEHALREQAEIIETVNRIGQTLAAELDQQKLVQAVTDAGTEISGAHFGTFFFNVMNEEGVSDIGMPGEDGYELIRRVRALPAEGGGRVPAIALTAYARAEDRMKALRSGCMYPSL